MCFSREFWFFSVSMWWMMLQAINKIKIKCNFEAIFLFLINITILGIVFPPSVPGEQSSFKISSSSTAFNMPLHRHHRLTASRASKWLSCHASCPEAIVTVSGKEKIHKIYVTNTFHRRGVYTKLYRHEIQLAIFVTCEY